MARENMYKKRHEELRRTSGSFDLLKNIANIEKDRVCPLDMKIDDLIPCLKAWRKNADYNKDKIELLTKSILKLGLLMPIVAWEQDNGKYMVLSGNSRVEAYKRLYEETGDKKYKTISGVIKKKDEIDEVQAQEIIKAVDMV